jgi:hypothetical protein
MDFSKLGQNERMATFGAIAVLLAGIISNWGGLLFLAILAAIGMLVVVFLPQFSAGTTLPGSKGSLMAAAGIVAAGAALITMLQWIGFLGSFGFSSTMFLVAVIGALVMAWAGWQELQSEGGTWRFGTASAPASDGAATRNEQASTPAESTPAEPREPIVGDEPTSREEHRTEA